MVVCTHIIDVVKIVMGQVESYKQCNVYNDIHVDVCVEIPKGEMNMRPNTKHTAHKTQMNRQVENKTYAHDTG